jgi:hypothetical protein
MKEKGIVVASALALLSGCAASTRILPAGPDTYTVTERFARIRCGATVLLLVFVVTMLSGPAHARAQVNVLTYHYNNQRTGWNPTETVLTPSNVSGLKLVASVPLDDLVDAQPLVFNGAVYVVTENNSVYAINAASNKVIASTNFGTPVATPPNGANSGHIGITSTPVIVMTEGHQSSSCTPSTPGR